VQGLEFRYIFMDWGLGCMDQSSGFTI
jgi:hypothetical protein